MSHRHFPPSAKSQGYTGDSAQIVFWGVLVPRFQLKNLVSRIKAVFLCLKHFLQKAKYDIIITRNRGNFLNWQHYLRGLLTSTLLFGGVLLFLTIFLGPEKGIGIIITYYISLFFFTLGISAILGFLIRRWWMHNEVLFGCVKISIRQAFLFSMFFVACLLLASLRLLNIWDGVILAISFILIEMYFKARSFDEI